MLMRAFLLLLLLGCNVSYAGLFGDSQAREQVETLRAKVKDMEARMSRMEETLMGQALIELHTQAEALKAEMGGLRGQIEVLQDENRTLRQQQKDFYLDLDSRLRQMEPEAATTSPNSKSTAPLLSQPTPVAAESLTRKNAVALQLPDAAQRERYDAAYTLFKQGDYSGAVAGFESFLTQHFHTTLAPAAAYWIGNAHYALRDFDKAIAAQQRLIETYPDSAKAPDALLNMASSQLEIGQKSVAKKTLENIIASYPYSEAAEKAKNRLRSIK
jgi:tol-pal system protein YbgF